MEEQITKYLKIKEVQKKFKKDGNLEDVSDFLDVNKLIDKKLKKMSDGKFDSISNNTGSVLAESIRSIGTEIKHLKASKAHKDFRVMLESDMDARILHLKRSKKVLVKALVERNL